MRRTFSKKHNACRNINRAKCFSKQTYASSMFGSTKEEWRQLRRMQGIALDGGGRARCLTTLIALEVGSDQDASFRQLPRQIQLWFQVWYQQRSLHAKIAKAWQLVKAKMDGMPENQRWRMMTGPVSGLLGVMDRICWVLHEPTVWSSPVGNRWTLDDSMVGLAQCDLAELLEEVLQSMLRVHWREAETGVPLGRGMAGGVDVTPAARVYRAATRSGRMSLAGAVRAVVTGAVWTRQMKFCAGYASKATCKRCSNEAPEDMQHWGYNCPANAAVDELREHDAILVEAQANWEAAPLLFGRGLVPLKELPEVQANWDPRCLRRAHPLDNGSQWMEMTTGPLSLVTPRWTPSCPSPCAGSAVLLCNARGAAVPWWPHMQRS